jgi:hypothetical protein
MWEDRYDSRATGVDYERIVTGIRSESEKRRMDRIMEIIKSLPNRIKMMAGVPNRTSVNEIEGVMEEQEAEAGVFDVVIIDYLNIMGQSAGKGRLDDWKAQEALAWDLIGLSQRKAKIVVTAIQAKMSGVKQENLDGTHSGRSIGIIQALDNVIGINQTDEERREGIIRFSPIILRDGKIKRQNCKVEAELWRMNVAKETRRMENEFLKSHGYEP